MGHQNFNLGIHQPEDTPGKETYIRSPFSEGYCTGRSTTQPEPQLRIPSSRLLADEDTGKAGFSRIIFWRLSSRPLSTCPSPSLWASEGPLIRVLVVVWRLRGRICDQVIFGS